MQVQHDRYVLLGDNVYVLVVGRLHGTCSQLSSSKSRHQRHASLGLFVQLPLFVVRKVACGTRRGVVTVEVYFARKKTELKCWNLTGWLIRGACISNGV